jgi:hypothetical protein
MYPNRNYLVGLCSGAIAALLLAGASAIGWLSSSYTPASAQASVIYPTQGYMDGLMTKDQLSLIDTDHDGTVSRDEWMAYQGRFFDALDKNKDGFLDANEFFRSASDNVIPFATLAYSHGLMTEPMFGKIDVNHDGKISKEEFVDYQMKVFDHMDKQKKQQLSIAELLAGKTGG